ncbi:MAG: MATE family efflux transporter [Kiritimatiellales bacterium]|nr:MATE family efflux transporter [Kiritimatiellales bacterium]
MKRAPVSFTEGSIVGAMLRLSVPIIIAHMLQSAYQIIDTFWVGRLSPQAVAAVSLTFPVNFLLIALGGGVALAGSVLISQYKGREDHTMMNHVAVQTLLMVLVISVVLSFVGYQLSEPIIRLMGAADDVLPDAVRFLQITFLGLIFVFIYFVYQSLMRGVGVVKAPMFIVLITVILNLFLDPLFIFGYGPIPAMGVSGAAMATLFTEGVAALIGLTLLFTGKHGFRLHVRDFKPDWRFMLRVFRLGWPASIEQSTRAFSMMVMTMLVATFGTITVAAYGIGVRVLVFVIIPSMGFAMATSTLVGQNLGAGKIDRAVRTYRIGSLITFGTLTIIGVVIYAVASKLVVFFIPEGGDAIIQSTRFLHIVALTFGCIGLQQISIGTLRGAGDTKASMMIVLITQWVIQFPCAYILAYHTPLGEQGIWWSFAITNILGAFIAVFWTLWSKWQHRTLLEDVVLKDLVIQEAEIDEGVVS